MPRKAGQTEARIAHYARAINAHRPCAPDSPGTNCEIEKVEVGFAPRRRLLDIREGDRQGLRRHGPSWVNCEQHRYRYAWRERHRAPVDRYRRDRNLRHGIPIRTDDACASRDGYN